MKYKYKALTENGQTIEGSIEAPNENEVISNIKSQRYIPINIERDIEADAQIELFSKKVKKKDLAVYCRQFYTMLDAGLGIIKCLDILVVQTENKTLKNTTAQVSENVQKGLSLSESMGKHKDIFPLLLIAMVDAGEVSGSLDTILERMAVHFEKENKLENKVKSSMVYPAVLAFVSVAVVIFMLVAVLPTFVGMFEGSGTALPGPTAFLIALSNSLRVHWYIYTGVVGLISMGIYTFKKSEEGQRFFDSMKLKIPIVKTTVIKLITARFTRTLSTLMSSGIPLIQALEVVGKVINNVIIQERLSAGIENIRKGVTLSRAIKDVGIFPPMVDSMVKIGEESGSLDDVLYKTADFYDDEVETSLQQLVSLVEPLMIVVMAFMIGFIVIAMYLPMFDVMNTI